MNPVLSAAREALRLQHCRVLELAEARKAAASNLAYADTALNDERQQFAEATRAYRACEAACVPVPDRRERQERICPSVDNPLGQDRRVTGRVRVDAPLGY